MNPFFHAAAQPVDISTTRGPWRTQCTLITGPAARPASGVAGGVRATTSAMTSRELVEVDGLHEARVHAGLAPDLLGDDLAGHEDDAAVGDRRLATRAISQPLTSGRRRSVEHDSNGCRSRTSRATRPLLTMASEQPFGPRGTRAGCRRSRARRRPRAPGGPGQRRLGDGSDGGAAGLRARQRDGERGSPAGLALHRDRAAVSGDEVLAEERPRPVEPADLVVEERHEDLARTSSDMPIPVSETLSLHPRSSRKVSMTTSRPRAWPRWR